MGKEAPGVGERLVIPRARLLLAAAVAGPALALGGVWPWVIPALAVLVAALLRTLGRREGALRLPVGLGLGLVAAAVTLVQVLPIPGLRAALAPALSTWIEGAREGIASAGWPSLSPTPADTALEGVRLLTLVGLAVTAAQLRWRTTARVLAGLGTAVAVIGLVQHALGITEIYGLYAPIHLPEGRDGSVLLTTFVNPNHQSGLLLVTGFATAALLVGQARGDRLETRIVLGSALVVQLAALVLSASRAALAAGALAGVVALACGWPRPRAGSRLSWLVAGAAVGAVALAAWHELGSLLLGPELDPATATRLRVTTSASALVSLAPLTGIGRGAFGDVFPAFDPEPSHVWHSHLECAPLAMVVEWGLLVGGALALLLPAWWLHAMRSAGRHDDARARRVALVGLLALALQGLADFSLELLGVAAPACALAGALAPSRPLALASRRARGLALGLAGLAVAATPLLPATWAWQQVPATGSDAAIARRPLHASLHREGAREALATGDATIAAQRARTAVRLEPGSVDGWLLLAAARAAQGDGDGERRALAEALGRLHRPASAELVAHLVARVPAPAELAALAPAAPEPWEHLMTGLLAHAPAHADAVAAARAYRGPRDPEPLRYRLEAALERDMPQLALHHARLWRGLEPHDPHAHLAVARALQAHPEPRTDALREALTLALHEVDPSDASLRGRVEEQLLRALLRPGAPVERERLVALARALRARPADDETRRRRLALVEPLLTAPSP